MIDLRLNLDGHEFSWLVLETKLGIQYNLGSVWDLSMPPVAPVEIAATSRIPNHAPFDTCYFC